MRHIVLIPALVVGGATIVAGCTSAFQVERSNMEGQPITDVKGLPFYVKTMVYRQHTAYEYSWLRVSLSIAPVRTNADGSETLGPKTVMAKDIRDDAAGRSALDALRDTVNRLPRASIQQLDTAYAHMLEAFKRLDPLPADHRNSPAESLMRRIGNYVERIPVVDYSTRYYLNAKVPFFGSSNLAAEVSADGTLAKASNEAVGGGSDAVTALTAAVTGTLPVKEYLTSKWTPSAGESNAPAGNAVVLSKAMQSRVDPVSLSFRAELAVEPQSAVFDFTHDLKSASSDDVLKRVPVDFTGGMFTVRVTADKPIEKAADDGISFSGKVQLPPAKQPKTPPEN